MTRPLVLAAVAVGLALAAGPAAAQTWGQPVYVSPYGHVIGGTPLSEVETRPYLQTGRWADGYTDQPLVYVPAPVYGRSYGDAGAYRRHGYGYGYGSGYRDRDRDRRSRVGYRDEWGYNDDRPPSPRSRSSRRGHDCECAAPYLYDR